MNSNLMQQAGPEKGEQRQSELLSSAAPMLGELSEAVGRHALLQAQVGVKITSHIIGISDELQSTQKEVASLRARIDELDRALAPRKRAARSSSR